jgi:hypothetical protein
MIGTHVQVTPAACAGTRTKNRIREQGSLGFVVEARSEGHRLFGNRPAILLRAVVGSDPWFGWLVAEEIAMIPWASSP